MSYFESLKAAGAEVLAYQSFGDWQGTWIAKVEHKGQTGFVVGAYGSCSGCDAFEAEFGWGEYDQDHLAEFGRKYLEFGDGSPDLLTKEEVSKRFDFYSDWDKEAWTALKWLEDV